MLSSSRCTRYTTPLGSSVKHVGDGRSLLCSQRITGYVFANLHQGWIQLPSGFFFQNSLDHNILYDLHFDENKKGLFNTIYLKKGEAAQGGGPDALFKKKKK
jgi:hypothetical protein